MINNKQFTEVGIIGFGGYVPKLRLKVEEIAKTYGKNGRQIEMSLGVKQKAVADKDEDTVSMGVEAGQRALIRAEIKANKLGVVLVGSESHPYAVKPTGTIVGDILGVGNEYICSDLQFACKAGTTGLIMMASMIEAGLIDGGLVIGADKAQSKPRDVLEYTAGAGAGAIILGNKKYKWWASLDRVMSFNSDTADFWRREGQEYPEHAGRFTGEPAYFKQVINCSERFFKKSKEKPADFDQVVFHMPNGKFPLRAGKRLGIKREQVEAGFLVADIGNPYSASSLLGLIKVMEEARKNEKILVVSYGSGAGSDCLSFKMKRKLTKKYKDKGVDLASQLKDIEYITYSDYLINK